MCQVSEEELCRKQVADNDRYYAELLNYIDLPVLDLHGKQKQQKRTNVCGVDVSGFATGQC